MDDHRLKSVPFFASLGRGERAMAARDADEVDVEAGTHLTVQGGFGYEFFVIEDGTATVRIDGEPRAALGPGDFFGEIAVVEFDRRTATVVADGPMRLIVMARGPFRALLRERPEIEMQVRRAIEERLAARGASGDS